MAVIRLLLIVTLLLTLYLAAMMVYAVPYAWVAAIALGLAMTCRKTYRYTSFGSARWAVASDIPHMLDGNSGLLVGTIDGNTSKLDGVKALVNPNVPAPRACETFLTACQPKRKQARRTVRLTQAVHLAVFAPTGVGKGVSCILPFLRTCTDSSVVIDPKGENYCLSASTRRRMGHKVIRLDPFGVCGPGSDTFNPLEATDGESLTCIDEIRDLAEALVVRTGQEKDPHWNDAAEIWIAAMTATAVCFAGGDDKNLQSVRALLTNPEKMQAAIKLMCESEDIWLARLGHQLTHFKDKELASCLTSTNRFMRFLDTIAIAESTRKSSFNPAELLTGRMTIYLILPPDHMRAQSPLLRLWIGSMLRAVVKGGLQETTKVHFILDESSSLGHMESLADALDKYRGYGVRLQFYYQSLGQLKKCWPDGQDQTLLSNVTQVFFGVNDQPTADYVSARTGEETIIISSGGTSSGRSHQSSPQGSNSSTSTNENDNWQQHGRKLLQPSEVMTLDPRVAITFAPGLPPIASWLVKYYEAGSIQPYRMGLAKICFDTMCLFVSAAFIAVMFTAALANRSFR